MSDPVSNSEIEDVLASIRRLVSENARALKRDREREGDDDKLVLTPAFRIDRSEAPVEEADVFAVDTETWNDAVRKSEAPAEADVFALSANSAREAPAAATDEPADGDDDDAVAPATALEQRIAELEQAVDLSAFALEPEAEPIEDATSEPTEAPEAEVDAAEATGDGLEPATENDDRAEASAEAIAEALAPVADAPDFADTDTDTDTDTDAGMTASEVEAADIAESAEAEPASAAEIPRDMATSEAPPRSWIEGLVSAAASREAARNAAAAPEAPEAREDAVDAEGSDETRAETIAEMQDEATAEADIWAETEPEDFSEAELPDEWAAAAAETDLAVGTDADEIAHEDAVDELTAADEYANEYDGAEGADTVVDDADSDTGYEVAEATEEDDLADDAAAGAEADAPTPERSWIDRLITAASALRGTHPSPAAETETEAGDWDDDQATEGDPAEDWATDETDGASEPETWDAAPAADAAEPVEPGWEEGAEDKVATEETGDAEAPEPEPDEAADNAVVGPWSRPADADADADETAEADEGGATTLVGVVAFAAAAERGYHDDAPAVEAEPEEVADDSAASLPLGAVVAEVVGRERDLSEAEAEPDTDEDAEAIASAWREEAEAAEIAYASSAEEAGEETPAEAAPDAGSEDPVDADAAAIVAAVEGGSDPDAVEFEWVEAEDIAPEDDAPAQNADAAEEVEPDVEIEAEALDADELDDQDDEAPEPVAAAPLGGAGAVQPGLTLASSRPEAAPAADVSASDGVAGAADEPAEPDIEVLADDETILDEAMLRELVAQLVRDELQGTVGERITHNVRRLIRREIARALSLQEFEK